MQPEYTSAGPNVPSPPHDAQDASSSGTSAPKSHKIDDGSLMGLPLEALQTGQLRSLSLSPAPSGRLSPIAHGAGPPHPHTPGNMLLASGGSMSWALQKFWATNKPAILVALSQFFGACMNLSARFLELEGDGMHPVQMLLMRQSVTASCCLVYMWLAKIADAPLGRKDIRWLLLVRGCSGFFGIYGVWWSMMYLPLADATVITFLSPGVAGFLCYFLLKEPFTRLEQLATLVALMGVVLIAQPAALFARGSPAADGAQQHHHPAEDPGHRPHGSIPGADHETTPQERLLAVGVALLGVFGAAGAFTTLRAIGKRAHPLISVNAFAVICTVVCSVALIIAPLADIAQPSMRWITPGTAKQWLLLVLLGVFGFIMQYLLASGLGADKSNRANSMIYTHMLFAVSFDRWIFGHHMGLMSFAGCTLILGSAFGVIIMKRPPPAAKVEDPERQGNLSGEAEASPMLVEASGHVESVNLTRLG